MISNPTAIRPQTVKTVDRILRALSEVDALTVLEANTIIANLRHLSKKGEMLPPITPKLLNQKETSAMLGIGLANFKKMEKAGYFPFKRKMVGTSVRYRNLDVIKYIMSSDEEDKVPISCCVL